jgi:hypothetical protein
VTFDYYLEPRDGNLTKHMLGSASSIMFDRVVSRDAHQSCDDEQVCSHFPLSTRHLDYLSSATRAYVSVCGKNAYISIFDVSLSDVLSMIRGNVN